MDKQEILACDDTGKFTGYIPKEMGHKDGGQRHLAIAVLLYNRQGQVLLQKRKHRIFDNIWDLTGATHLLHKPHPCHPERLVPIQSGLVKDLPGPRKIASSPASPDPRNDKKCKICNEDNMDETMDEACLRCLKTEWSITDRVSVKQIGEFNYFAKIGPYCENEHCYLLIGEYNGEFGLNPEVGYEYKWMDKEQFLEDIKNNPQNYTPWATAAVIGYKKY